MIHHVRQNSVPLGHYLLTNWSSSIITATDRQSWDRSNLMNCPLEYDLAIDCFEGKRKAWGTLWNHLVLECLDTGFSGSSFAEHGCSCLICDLRCS
jgi:hypothetical protein